MVSTLALSGVDGGGDECRRVGHEVEERRDKREKERK